MAFNLFTIAGFLEWRIANPRPPGKTFNTEDFDHLKNIKLVLKNLDIAERTKLMRVNKDWFRSAELVNNDQTALAITTFNLIRKGMCGHPRHDFRGANSLITLGVHDLVPVLNGAIKRLKNLEAFYLDDFHREECRVVEMKVNSDDDVKPSLQELLDYKLSLNCCCHVCLPNPKFFTRIGRSLSKCRKLVHVEFTSQGIGFLFDRLDMSKLTCVRTEMDIAGQLMKTKKVDYLSFVTNPKTMSHLVSNGLRRVTGTIKTQHDLELIMRKLIVVDSEIEFLRLHLSTDVVYTRRHLEEIAANMKQLRHFQGKGPPELIAYLSEAKNLRVLFWIDINAKRWTLDSTKRGFEWTGQLLKHLVIELPRFDQTVLRAIIAYCPNLIRLELDNGVASQLKDDNDDEEPTISQDSFMDLRLFEKLKFLIVNCLELDHAMFYDLKWPSKNLRALSVTTIWFKANGQRYNYQQLIAIRNHLNACPKPRISIKSIKVRGTPLTKEEAIKRFKSLRNVWQLS